MLARRKVAVILQLWQNYDRGILQGIAAYVRERRDWSVFVEEVEHQRIPDFKTWDGDGLIVNFDNPHVVRALRGVNKPIIAVADGTAVGRRFLWPVSNSPVSQVRITQSIGTPLIRKFQVH